LAQAYSDPFFGHSRPTLSSRLNIGILLSPSLSKVQLSSPLNIGILFA